MVIQMNNANWQMLEEIRSHLGGSVRRRGKFCLWCEDHQRRLWRLLEIFERYPPLTSRIQCQVHFLRECAARRSVPWMLQHRALKYDSRAQCIKRMESLDICQLHYFPIWCSGFITGEGCFSLKRSGCASFSIGQKFDRYLIQSLRDYFGGQNRCRSLAGDFYLWQVYRRSVISQIISHAERYPLLGEKGEQLCNFLARLERRAPPLHL